MSFHVPGAARRPGETPDFSDLRLSPAGSTARPDVLVEPRKISDLASRLIRVLDEDGAAVGPWAPGLSKERLVQGLRAMLVTRAYDERMFRAQRQGKSSFYMKCRGEEAVAVAGAFALEPSDMGFPTYRQQGLLIARGYPLKDMMCQVFSNAGDPLKGRQMPVFYSSREYGFFSISGNLGTQYSQAVGWAMASTYKNDSKIACAWIGEGATAEGDFHYAMTFASAYRPPVILNIVNNHWAISTAEQVAKGQAETFAARGVGYGLPSLRVDGNDFLAIYAATRWAAERARAGGGATVIELITYRAEGHSTSDDPGKYRPSDEASAWPLGDPIERFRLHLETTFGFRPEDYETLAASAAEEVLAAFKAAEAIGVLGKGERPDPATLFDDVYREMPWHLKQQKAEAGL